MATITLPPVLEQAMTEQAKRQGTTLEVLALDKLNAAFLPATPDATVVEGETLADFLGDFIGCIDSGEHTPGGARMSENIGEKFAQGMVEKHQAGKL
jgi:hypothetical protein